MFAGVATARRCYAWGLSDPNCRCAILFPQGLSGRLLAGKVRTRL